MRVASPSEEALNISAPKSGYQEFEADSYRDIRRLIWLYMIFWLIEGGLRRWFLPGLATPLLLVRDPVAVAIYFLAWSKGLFPTNGFILTGVGLAFLTFGSALMVGHDNPVVALYGMRCDFLHVPLIFIMGRVLRQKDVLNVAKIGVWLVMPYTVLLVAQFYQPQSAWVNRGVGGSLDGAGFDGGGGHFRPPGTFSFITGTAQFYSIVAACWFVLLLARKLPAWLMAGSAMAIMVAIPISISRTLFLSVMIVCLVGVIAMLLGGRLSFSLLVQVVLAAIFVPFLAAYIPAFKDGMEAFGSRWQNATTDSGGFKGAIVDRLITDLFGSFDQVGLTGLGTGFSTIVGQKLLTGEAQIGAAEAEWGRLLFDNGIILGGLLVIYRVALAGSIALTARQAWRQSPGGMIFVSAAFMNLLIGQWGQATTLGAAVIAGGLALAAANEEEMDVTT